MGPGPAGHACDRERRSCSPSWRTARTSSPERPGSWPGATSIGSSTSCSSTRRASTRWPTSSAAGTCADSIVLVGDPNQLPMVTQGVHPEGANVSGLAHLLGSETTLAPDRGLFLGDDAAAPSARERVRVRGVLRGSTGVARRRVPHDRGAGLRRRNDGLVGAGVRWLPIEHAGNAARSVEEAERVAEIVGELVGRRQVGPDGTEHADRAGRRDRGHAVQRPGRSDPGRAASPPGSDGQRRDRGSVPGPRGRRRDLFDGELEPGGCPARHGLPLLAQPAQRRGLARGEPGHRRCVTEPPGGRLHGRRSRCGSWMRCAATSRSPDAGRRVGRTRTHRSG